MIEKGYHPIKGNFEIVSLHELCEAAGYRFQAIELGIKNPGPNEMFITENPCRNNPFMVKPGDLIALQIVTDGKWRYIDLEIE